MYDFANYTGDARPPPAANSGDFLWATILYADYTNSGDTSVLSQDFDLTGFVSAEMKFANWAEVFFNFDTAQVLVKTGDLIYERDTSAPPTAWEEITVDLTPYAGDIAQVRFELFASTVVDRAGWYIDDVSIIGTRSRAGNDEPGPPGNGFLVRSSAALPLAIDMTVSKLSLL